MIRHRIADSLFLDEEDLLVEGVRASGPGGQNVNKVSSAVTLRLPLDRLTGMDEAMRARLALLAGRRLTADGVLVLKAQTLRTQSANRAAAVARLLELLRAAAVAPRPRVRTKIGRGQRRQRLDAKRRRGAVKQMRRTGSEET